MLSAMSTPNVSATAPSTEHIMLITIANEFMRPFSSLYPKNAPSGISAHSMAYILSVPNITATFSTTPSIIPIIAPIIPVK